MLGAMVGRRNGNSFETHTRGNQTCFFQHFPKAVSGRDIERATAAAGKTLAKLLLALVTQRTQQTRNEEHEKQNKKMQEEGTNKDDLAFNSWRLKSSSVNAF